MAGGVEAYIDVSWTADAALTYCGEVPSEERGACYGEIGARMALVEGDGRDRAPACAGVPPEYMQSCAPMESKRAVSRS